MKILRPLVRGLFVPVGLVFILQAAALHLLSLPEANLPTPALHKLPNTFGNWNMLTETTLESSVIEYLKPDDYVLREYGDRTGKAPINLFVAYFKSLQNNYGPHSPRVCLPGSGWLVRSSKSESVKVPTRVEPIPVNEYVLEKSGNRLLVVYWYQNDRAVWAEEFQAKLNLLPDLIRYRRSDVSLVRLTTAIRGTPPDVERARTLEFTRSIFPLLAERFATVQ